MTSKETQMDLAQRIADGLGGWLQLQAAQDLHELHGEDTAQFTMMQVVYSRHQWRVEPSAKPTNWSSKKKHRVDVALRPWKTNDSTWYGVIEVKWPGSSIDRGKERRRVLHDVLRVISVKTSNPNIVFMVLGGSAKTIAALFDDAHTELDLEAQRTLINKLLKRELKSPTGKLEASEVARIDPNWANRVPAEPALKINNRITTTLLAVATPQCGGKEAGSVFVWQCQNGKGAPKKKATTDKTAK